MEPIEEELRTLFVDIVRNCQSTVAHNWERMNVPSASTRISAQPAPRETVVIHAMGNGSNESSRAGADNCGLDSSVNPPDLDDGGIDGVILSIPVSPDLNDGAMSARPVKPSFDNNQGNNLAQISEFGYTGILEDCQCPCHHTSGLSSTLGGTNPIQLGVCTYTNLLLQTACATIVLPTISSRILTSLMSK